MRRVCLFGGHFLGMVLVCLFVYTRVVSHMYKFIMYISNIYKRPFFHLSG